MGAVSMFAILVLVVVWTVATYRAVWRLTGRAEPFCRYEQRDGQVVVHVDLPRWLGVRRTLRAPVTDISGARVLVAGEDARRWIKTYGGVSLGGLRSGWFWRDGRCFAARRVTRDALQIDFARGRVKHWVVDVADPAAVVAELAPQIVTTS